MIYQWWLNLFAIENCGMRLNIKGMRFYFSEKLIIIFGCFLLLCFIIHTIACLSQFVWVQHSRSSSLFIVISIATYSSLAYIIFHTILNISRLMFEHDLGKWKLFLFVHRFMC